jgi:hypothetical protein
MIKYTFFFFLFFLTKVEAQQIIELKNPSLEGLSASGVTPKSWQSWGFRNESEPDIQPNQFGVATEAHRGYTYVGMVVRDNNTYESIGQNLPYENRLMKGKKYKMSLYLAKSTHYMSRSSTTGEYINYNVPAILKIWGRNSKTKKKELLAKSAPIEKEYWDIFIPTFSPKEDDFDIIIFEAYYRDGTKEPYSGNLLIDNLSDIKEIIE